MNALFTLVARRRRSRSWQVLAGAVALVTLASTMWLPSARAAELTDLTFTLETARAGETGVVTIHYTNATLITAAGARVQITFPAGFDLSDVAIVQSAGFPLGWLEVPLTVHAQTIEFVTNGSPSANPQNLDLSTPGQPVTMRLTGVRNPVTAGPTGTFSYAIVTHGDQGTAAGAMIVSGPPDHITLAGPADVEAGAESSEFTLTVVDAYGNPTDVGQDTVFNLTSDSVGVHSFSTGATATVPSGEATAEFTYQDVHAGAQTVAATWASGIDAGLEGDSDTHVITVTPGDPTQLAFAADTIGGTSTAAGLVLPPVEVEVQDEYGNPADVPDLEVTATLQTGVGEFVPLATTTVAAVDGVATFNNLGIDLVDDDYTIRFSQGALSPITTGTFSITPDVADHLVTVVSDGATTAGESFTLLSVTALDQWGNVATGHSGPRTLAYTLSAGANGPAGAQDVFTSAVVFAAGRVMSPLHTTLHRAQAAVTITAVDPLLGNVVGNVASAAFEVRPGTAARLVATSADAAAGAGEAIEVTLTAEDAWGNLATGYTGDDIPLTLVSPDDLRAPDGTDATIDAVVDFNEGVATFTLEVYRAGASVAHVATEDVSTAANGGTGLAVTIAPDEVSLADSTAEAVGGASVIVSDAANQDIRVTVRDQYENPINGAPVTLGATGDAEIDDDSIGTNASGETTFLVSNRTVGTSTFTATVLGYGALEDQLVVTFFHGPAAYFEMTGPGAYTAGAEASIPVVITAFDEFGNQADGANGGDASYDGLSEVALTFSGATAGLGIPEVRNGGASTAFGNPVQVTFDNGQSTDDLRLTLFAAETGTIHVSGGGISSALGGVGLAFTTSAVAANAGQSSIALSADTVDVGETVTITVTVRDEFGNVSGGGDDVAVYVDGALHAVTGGDLTDHADGTYTVGFTAQASGNYHVQAYLSRDDQGDEIGAAVDIEVSGAAVVASVSLDEIGAGEAVQVAITYVSAHPVASPGGSIQITFPDGFGLNAGTIDATVSLDGVGDHAAGVAVTGNVVTITLRDALLAGDVAITFIAGVTSPEEAGPTGAFSLTTRSSGAEVQRDDAFSPTDQIVAGPPAQGQSTVAVDVTTVNANGVGRARVTVTVRDQFRNPINSVVVSVSGAEHSTVTPEGDPITLPSGIIVFTVTNDTVEEVTYTFTTGGGDVGQATVNFVAPVVDAAASNISPLAQAGYEATADGLDSGEVTVIVVDTDGQPIPDVTVTLGQGSGGSQIASDAVTTDGAGVAAFSVTSTKVETVTYTASVGGVTLAETAQITFTPGPRDATTTLFQASPAGAVTASANVTLTITLRDQFANHLGASDSGTEVVVYLGDPESGGTLFAGGNSEGETTNGTFTIAYTQALTGTVTFYAFFGTDAAHPTAIGTMDVTFTSAAEGESSAPGFPLAPAPASGPQVTRVNQERSAPVQADVPAEVATRATNGSTAKVNAPANVIPTGGTLKAAAVDNLGELISQAPPPANVNVALAFVLEAEDADGNPLTEFDEPLALEFTLPASSVPTGATSDTLVLAFWNGTKWMEVEGTVTQNADGSYTIEAAVNHFTIFAVQHHPHRGTFLPAAAEGVSLTIWGGGSYELLAAALPQGGSVWVTTGGRFTGYIVGAPAFVNHAFTTLFPLGVDVGQPVLVVSFEARPDQE